MPSQITSHLEKQAWTSLMVPVLVLHTSTKEDVSSIPGQELSHVVCQKSHLCLYATDLLLLPLNELINIFKLLTSISNTLNSRYTLHKQKLSRVLNFSESKSLQMVTAAMNLKDAYSLEGKL